MTSPFGALVMHFWLEETVVPNMRYLVFLSASGLFLFAGHYLLFMAYRFGPTAVVAPLYYFVSFWAILAGALVFGTTPNPLTIAGITLVVLSGPAIVIFGHFRVKPKTGLQLG